MYYVSQMEDDMRSIMGEPERYRLRGLDGERDLIVPGVLWSERSLGVAAYEEDPIFVRHTRKTATLHKFVSGVDYFEYRGGLGYGVDYCEMDSFGKTLLGFPELQLVSETDIFMLHGLLGSVCTSCNGELDFIVSLMTLYELLSKVQRKLGFYIMKYDKIHFCNYWDSSACTLSLIHNAESDKFFTKMYMEALSVK